MAKQISSRELVRVVAAEFDRKSWVDSEELALAIATQAEQRGILDAHAAAGLAQRKFLETNGISKATLEELMAGVFAGRALIQEHSAGPTYIDQSVKIGNNTTVNGSINAGGNQLILSEGSPPSDILDGLTRLVEAANKDHSFTDDELELLDRLAALRGLEPQELEDAARAGIERARPESGRLARFRDAVAASATSGLVVQAILAVVAGLL